MFHYFLVQWVLNSFFIGQSSHIECIVLLSQGVIVIMNKEKSDIIEDIAKMLLTNNNEAAKKIIVNQYPHKAVKVEKRKYTMAEKLEQFLSDGFIDRYTGKRLINPGMLKVISTYFPDEFPFHPHWKMTQTHIAFWELIPTIDHIYPIAKGGHDDKENRVTTSMKNNSIKSNYTIDEINWNLYPKGNLADWDGLTSLFVEIVNKDKELLKDNYIKNWYNVSQNSVECISNRSNKETHTMTKVLSS